ncbi:hypothetical protein [Natronospora cellulosivora (SeqCode)]
MKKKILRNVLIVGALVAVFLLPIFTEASNNHWAETDVLQLSRNDKVGAIFKNRNLNDSIKIEDFQYLVGEVLGREYQGVPEAVSREAIVYELSKIWADQVGRDLETVPVIRMLIYSDTEEIDQKYRHASTVAYMTEIAKGKAPGVFAPKDEVTYGELAVMINNTKKAIENELRYQSNKVEEGLLESASFETIGKYQIEEDKLVFDFELINHHSEKKGSSIWIRTTV